MQLHKEYSSATRQRGKVACRHREVLNHVVQPLPIPLPTERVPLLRECQELKHRVRGTNQKDMLDNHLITYSP